MNAISQEFIEKLLTEAKEEHTKKHGDDPNHDWVPFYAEYIRFGIIQEAIADLNVTKYVMQKKRDGNVLATSAVTHEVKTIHDFSYDGKIEVARDQDEPLFEPMQIVDTIADNPDKETALEPHGQPSVASEV